MFSSRGFIGITLAFGVLALVGGAAFLLFSSRETILTPEALGTPPGASSSPAVALPTGTPAASTTASSTAPQTAPPVAVQDLPDQPQLSNPPEIVRGIYLTNWTAGYAKRLTALTDLVEKTELNAMVIDVKDYSGYVAYRTGIPEVVAAGAERDIRIPRPNAMIKALHDKGIYLIARVSVFQDPLLAKAHPEWAVQNTATGKLWMDRKGLSWMSVPATPVWDYNIAIARDALRRGFDEVNFDYIRFPSDGDLSVAGYPLWEKGKETRHEAVARFFAYARKELPGAKISADLFGLVTSATDDLGIGQIIEDGYRSFDYVSPMVYPSHFAAGYGGFQNPAAYPYEVIELSMAKGLARLVALERAAAGLTATSTAPVPVSGKFARLRPWLQAFNLGATYDAKKINDQIRATEAVLNSGPNAGHYAGWLLWDPSNHYASYQP